MPIASRALLICTMMWCGNRFVQDACKVGYFSLMVKHNWFGYNNTGILVMPASANQFILDHEAEEAAQIEHAKTGGRH